MLPSAGNSVDTSRRGVAIAIPAATEATNSAFSFVGPASVFVDVTASGFSNKDSVALSFAFANATVRSEVCVVGAGDRSGTVDGDLVPSADSLMDGGLGAMPNPSDACGALVRLRGT